MSSKVYTDGSSLGQKRGGWAALAEHEDGTIEVRTGRQDNATNNQMELKAAIEGAKMSRGAKSVVTSDSEYTVLGITDRRVAKWKKNGWMTSGGTPVKNQQLWKQFDNVVRQNDVTLKWVRGHNGHEQNEIVDKLAKHAAAGYPDLCIVNGRKK